jgi:lipoprotein-releasing system ATP-binding protein
MINNFLKIFNLSKSYNDKTEKIHVLKKVDLLLSDNKIVALVGPSGSGKSTLLHLIGLLDKPDSGSIFFEKRDLLKLSDNEKTDYRRSLISFVYQNNNLISDLTALENVSIAHICKTQNKIKAFRQAEKILKDFGLSNRINHYPYQLSGGEQQRVAIARALINNPKLIIADEPTGNLDKKNTDLILNFLLSLKQPGRLILIATHNRELASKVDLRLTLMNGSVKIDSK